MLLYHSSSSSSKTSMHLLYTSIMPFKSSFLASRIIKFSSQVFSPIFKIPPIYVLP
ncbi:MAG: hypothetical protein N3E39_00135 [Candidatus Methanomethylicia archaeon]|nr:hypothetical protein [Candidatus Methanomethylicia archaeon]